MCELLKFKGRTSTAGVVSPRSSLGEELNLEWGGNSHSILHHSHLKGQATETEIIKCILKS